MKKTLEILRSLFQRIDSGPESIVHAKAEIRDPVYHFFFEVKADERKREFDRALKAADADQRRLIEKYDLLQKGTLSV